MPSAKSVRPEALVIVERIARMCLALPGTAVKPAQGAMAYQVRDKTFAMAMDDHHGNGRVELWAKNSLQVQQEWVTSDARRYYIPPYVGRNGWIGVWLDAEPDWSAVAELLVDGYLVQSGTPAADDLDPGALAGDVRAAGAEAGG